MEEGYAECSQFLYSQYVCVCAFYRCSGEAEHHEQRGGVWPECIHVCVCVCVCVCVHSELYLSIIQRCTKALDSDTASRTPNQTASKGLNSRLLIYAYNTPDEGFITACCRKVPPTHTQHPPGRGRGITSVPRPFILAYRGSCDHKRNSQQQQQQKQNQIVFFFFKFHIENTRLCAVQVSAIRFSCL